MAAITLDQANWIIAEALGASLRAGYAPMAVVVIDESGNIKAVQRQDGASMFRVDVARGKAWGAVAFGISSGELAARASDNPNFFLALSATAEGRLLPQPGAVLIRAGESGPIMGAVGASGGTGEQDEEICIAGVTAAGLST